MSDRDRKCIATCFAGLMLLYTATSQGGKIMSVLVITSSAIVLAIPRRRLP